MRTPGNTGGTKLSPEVQAKICAALEAGNTHEISANIGGISGKCFRDWLVRGRTGEEPFAAFLEAVTMAKAHAVNRYVTVIASAAVGDKDRDPTWTAAAWWLSRRQPHEWGKWREDVKGGAIDADVTPEQLAERGMTESLAHGDADSAAKFLNILQALNPEKWRKSADPTDQTGSVIVNFPVPSPKF